MSPRPLINVDLGELPGEPDELYALADVANIACGGHAGNLASMTRAVEACLRGGARVGAHPSFPDRPGFGRARMSMSPAALRESVTRQCAELASVADRAGVTISWVKPHGALYHAAHEDREHAEAIVAAAKGTLGTHVTIVGPALGALQEAARRTGLAFAREGFADRGTRPDGSLIARGQPGAQLCDPDAAATTAVALARSGQIDTVCVHGDTPGAVDIARAVRAALEALTA